MRDAQRIKKIKAGLGKVEKRANRRKYKCIFPECTTDAIKSHSQQKKHQLESISEDSFVFAMVRNMYSVAGDSEKELLVKQCIGEASRYKGYCNSHDTSIFSPIENGGLDINDPEHNFLLLLRSVSFEYANKRGMYDRQKDVLAKLGDLFSPSGRKGYEASIFGSRYFLEKDAPYYLSRLFEIYESRDWKQIKYNSFTLGRNIGVSSTTSFSPMREAHSEWAIENFEEVQPYIAFNVVPEDNKTSISFVWFSEFDSFCTDYSNISPHQGDINSLLNAYIFCESEDVCVRPSLWQKLKDEERHKIYRHMGNSDSLSGANEIPMVIDV